MKNNWIKDNDVEGKLLYDNVENDELAKSSVPHVRSEGNMYDRVSIEDFVIGVDVAHKPKKKGIKKAPQGCASSGIEEWDNVEECIIKEQEINYELYEKAASIDVSDYLESSVQDRQTASKYAYGKGPSAEHDVAKYGNNYVGPGGSVTEMDKRNIVEIKKKIVESLSKSFRMKFKWATPLTSKNNYLFIELGENGLVSNKEIQLNFSEKNLTGMYKWMKFSSNVSDQITQILRSELSKMFREYYNH